MIDRPEPVLRGRQTFLRPVEREDVPLLVGWLNDLETIRYIGARSPMGHALEERWFERVTETHGRTRWFFLICRLDDRRPIGTIGLDDVDLTNGNAEMGITIGEVRERDQGFGTDALEALLDFGFASLRLERIGLQVYDFNARAIRSYEKAGFVREGASRHAMFREGRYVDLVEMAILRDEWAARRAAEPFPGSWVRD